MSFDTVHRFIVKMELIRGLSLPLYTVSKEKGGYQYDDSLIPAQRKLNIPRKLFLIVCA